MRKGICILLIMAVCILLLPVAVLAGSGGGGSASSAAASVAATSTTQSIAVAMSQAGGDPCRTGQTRGLGRCASINKLVSELIALSYTFASLEDAPTAANIDQSVSMLVRLSAFK